LFTSCDVLVWFFLEIVKVFHDLSLSEWCDVLLTHVAKQVILLLFKNDWFLADLCENWTDCIHAVSKQPTRNQCHSHNIHFFIDVNRIHITIADSDHCDNCKVYRVDVAYEPFCFIKILVRYPISLIIRYIRASCLLCRIDFSRSFPN
jgi:hypothetical protein